MADERRRRRLPRVEAGDRHAPGEDAAVEVRDEPRERAQERRLTASGRTEQRDVLAVVDRQRDAVQHRAPGDVGEAQVVDLR